VKTIPFLPNLGYAFVVLKAFHSLKKMSWHGRPPIKTERQRISILNTFYSMPFEARKGLHGPHTRP
jgi:hypothetical protein